MSVTTRILYTIFDVNTALPPADRKAFKRDIVFKACVLRVKNNEYVLISQTRRYFK